MPIPQMLEASAAILEEFRDQENEEMAQLHEQALQLLKDEADTARKTIESKCAVSLMMTDGMIHILFYREQRNH